MRETSTQSNTVVIIGGGFTGAAIAYHLDRVARSAARILVVEPRETLGGGLAYSSRDPAHRINVPASRMGIDPDEPLGFEAWLADTKVLRDDSDARLADGRAFPRRAIFGRYVSEQLGGALKAGRVTHLRDTVVAVRRGPSGYDVALASGHLVGATIAVIASTHPSPSAPSVLSRNLAGDERYIPDSNAPNALEAIGPRDRVLIVGAGLTMADIVASLDRRGHVGPITALSRRGQLPGEHPSPGTPMFGDFLGEPSRTARQLVRAVRATLARAAAAGLPWQSVFDTLREQARWIWLALEFAERRKVARRLRPYWDARRFRIAPQVQAVLDRRREEGAFTSLAGAIRDAQVSPRGLAISFQPRGAEDVATREFDAVVIATGPAHSDIFRSQPYLKRLAADGLVALDWVGLGLATDARGRALGHDERPTKTLFVGGPLARGTFGELMGLPEVSRYARDIANEIAAELRERLEGDAPARVARAHS